MPLLTTCLGAFPKPFYLPIKDWFQIDMADEAYSRDVVGGWTDDAKHDPVFRQATEEAIKAQIEAGIDIVTDGEQRRENYVHYQCRHFTGFDFENLEMRDMRNGAYTVALPVIRGKVSTGRSVLVRDYQDAQAIAGDVPVKMTLPGPLTIMDTTANAFYEDDAQLAADLAEALNAEVRALIAAGCRNIQIDEPVFARKPDAALAYGIDALERCFMGTPNLVNSIVHMCCGYPDRLDNPDYPKADPQAYHDLVGALDGIVNQISIEDCHRHNDLKLFEKFENATAIVGFVDVASSKVETIKAIEARMREILTVLPEERLIAAPDCGLGFLSAEKASAKLTNLVKAAQRV